MSLMFFLFKKKTAYEMRISDWSSDGCSADFAAMAGLAGPAVDGEALRVGHPRGAVQVGLQLRCGDRPDPTVGLVVHLADRGGGIEPDGEAALRLVDVVDPRRDLLIQQRLPHRRFRAVDALGAAHVVLVHQLGRGPGQAVVGPALAQGGWTGEVA